MSQDYPNPPHRPAINPGYSNQTGLPILIKKKKPSNFFTVWPGIVGSLTFMIIAIINVVLSFRFETGSNLPFDILLSWGFTGAALTAATIFSIITCVQAGGTTESNVKLAILNLIVTLTVPLAFIGIVLRFPAVIGAA